MRINPLYIEGGNERTRPDTRVSYTDNPPGAKTQERNRKLSRVVNPQSGAHPIQKKDVAGGAYGEGKREISSRGPIRGRLEGEGIRKKPPYAGK